MNAASKRERSQAGLGSAERSSVAEGNAASKRERSQAGLDSAERSSVAEGNTAPMPAGGPLDATDLSILRLLQQEGRLTNKELAARIHLSASPTYERVKRLEQRGYIKHYSAVLDSNLFDRGFVVFCNITMRTMNKQVAEQWKQAVSGWSEVAECFNTSGDHDYMLRVCVASMADYRQFVLDKVGTFPHIAHIQSVFVLHTIKEYHGIPI